MNERINPYFSMNRAENQYAHSFITFKYFISIIIFFSQQYIIYDKIMELKLKMHIIKPLQMKFQIFTIVKY